jgi:protein gp37
MSETSIDWTERVWNPTTGCTKVSPGCKNCYAEKMAKRLEAMETVGYEKGFSPTFHPDRLAIPLERKKPAVFFVNSMSDLFHEAIPDDFIFKAFEVMSRCPQHIFQVLTKRAERMADFFAYDAWKRPPANVWLGVTVENQAHGLPRIECLQRVDASVRFLSCEPLLENLGEVDLRGIDWVIVGGESGGKARIMEKEWALHLRDLCAVHEVPFFFKQWGEWVPLSELPPLMVVGGKGKTKLSCETYHRIGKSHAGVYGKMLDGQLHRHFPRRSKL